MQLLEREPQLSALREYAEDARRGDGRLVLVSGESGVGKSSLVEQFQRELTATWVWGACDGLFTPRPLGPIHDIARQVGGDLLALTSGGASRDVVFEAVLRWMLVADELQVMVVEDVQWADEATLDLLRLLGRRLRDARVLLMVTFRDDALSPSDPLRVLLGEVSGQRSTRRIDLPPLSPTGVRTLAEGTRYAPGDLYRLTGGNPFFLVEVLSSAYGDIPVSARDAVLARVATVDDEARRTLEIASLDGSRLDPGLVTAATGARMETFDQLVAAGLLQADGPWLRFRHELARRAVESTVPSHRRVPGHRALLHALEEESCNDDARMAYHAEGAGEVELVRRYALPAARQAAALGAHREAAAQFERALRFATADSPRELAELYDAYADSLALVDRWPQAVDARQRAIAIWHDLGEPRREGHDQRKLSAVMWRLCRGPESAAALARAIELLGPLGADPELARALATRAFSVWPSDQTAAAEMLDQARSIADALGDDALSSDVANNLSGFEYVGRRDWTATMHEALRLALAVDAGPQVGRAYANAYTFYAAQFRFAEGERFWREGIAYCDERDITTFSTCLRGHRALALLDLGRWDEAAALADRVLATEASPVNLLTSQITLGLIRARCGRADGQALLDAAVEAAESVDEAEWVAATRLARAEASWLADDDDAAITDLVRTRARITPMEFTEDALLSVWERRLLGEARPASPAPEPWASWLAGDLHAAVARWDRLGCRYHAAMTLLDSSCDDDLRQAITRFEALGADAAARRTRRRMKELGHRAVPTGARATTREHPAGLTRREDEVLALMSEGLSNDDIARRLVVSVRTVDHHVSAVLTKLGVSSRAAAAAEARRRGLLPAAT